MLSAGNDIASIYGNGGDTLTINAGAYSLTLSDGDTGQLLYTVGTGGTSITAYGVAHITVLGPNGNVLWNR